MRIVILAATLLFALASPGEARDRWSGFYLGGHFGYGSADASADVAILGIPSFSASESLSGILYGAQAGYNWQLGSFVLGVEGDIMGTEQNAQSMRVCSVPTCAVGFTNSSDDRLPWMGTLRGRLGYSLGRVMLYGTAGAGFGKFESSQTFTTALTSISTVTTEQRMAFVVGGGIEAAITGNWSARLEYLYFDTGEFDTTYSVLGIGLVTETDRLTQNIVRLGVNYRF